MTRKLLAALGVLAVVGTAAYTIRPAGHISPYDANLVRLVETRLEAWCSGVTFWLSRGMGDADGAAECRAELEGRFSNTPDMIAVEGTWCSAFLGASGGSVQMTADECLDILRSQQLWPTYDGGLSRDWNRARPYPGSVFNIEQPEDESRTGQRRPLVRTPATREDSPLEIPTSDSSATVGPTGPTGGTGPT